MEVRDGEIISLALGRMVVDDGYHFFFIKIPQLCEYLQFRSVSEFQGHISEDLQAAASWCTHPMSMHKTLNFRASTSQ